MCESPSASASAKKQGVRGNAKTELAFPPKSSGFFWLILGSVRVLGWGWDLPVGDAVLGFHEKLHVPVSDDKARSFSLRNSFASKPGNS
eukprot:scaffold40334_cov26-Tisochrysis_lutea.AAC.1